VWASIQSPYSQRDVIARVLGLPPSALRVIVPDVGGAFGPKGQVYADEVLVAAAAFRLRRPVKWAEARREHLRPWATTASNRTRPPSRSRSTARSPRSRTVSSPTSAPIR